MNVCPVCRNVNQRDATVCRYCQTALTPPPPEDAAVAPPRRRRWPWIGAAVAVVLLLGLGGLTLFGDGAAEAGQTAAEATAIQVGTGEGASLDFEPAAVEAPADTQIVLTFVNESTLPHNLTFQEGISAATSNLVAAGASETLTFTPPGPGTYPFVCTIHPGMVGDLTVGGAADGAAETTPVEGTAAPAEGAEEPAAGTAEPTAGTAEPSTGTAEPAEGTATPVEGTAEPAEGAATGTSVEVGTAEGATLEFAPATVEAPANTEVTLTFTNQSSVPHNLTFQEGISAATSTLVAAGASETLTFTTPDSGDYTFVCTIHPGMDGILRVR